MPGEKQKVMTGGPDPQRLPRATSRSAGHRVVRELVARPAERPHPALRQRRDEPVQGRLPRARRSATTRARPPRRSASARAASTTTSRTSGAPRATTRSSRCWATSPSATTSRRTRSPTRGSSSRGTWACAKDRLKVTIFKGEAACPRDAEAHGFWLAHVPADRILELGAKDNFWAMGDTGPCGPCSEIHFFQGDDAPLRRGGGGPRVPGRRVRVRPLARDLEPGVHAVRPRRRRARSSPLPAPCVDTGMGLERVTAVVQGKLIELRHRPLPAAHPGRRRARAGTTYGASADDDVSLRVVADHLRATTFLIADGVMPGNEGRGYVLRKIMRRAHAPREEAGRRGPFLHELDRARWSSAWRAPTPSCARRRPSVARVVRAEEERFGSTLKQAMAEFEQDGREAARAGGAASSPAPTPSGSTTPTACPSTSWRSWPRTAALQVDREGFERELEGQRERARQASKMGAVTGDPAVHGPARRRARREFSGYEALVLEEARVLAVLKDGAARDAARRGRGGRDRPRPHAVLRRSPAARSATTASSRAEGSAAEVVDTRPARARPLRPPREGDRGRLRARA